MTFFASSFVAAYEHPVIAAAFADDAWGRELVRTEVALARAQAQAGVIPSSAAQVIAERCESVELDMDRIAAATARDGFPIIGLVEQLRAHVGPDAGAFVHRAATTQDILDTAMILQLQLVFNIIELSLAGICKRLAVLADRHRSTLMVARTHLQPAVPTTFGLLVSGWLEPFLRHRRRLAELRPRLLVVQCGGAGGTLAALGDKGPTVVAAFAKELGLAVHVMPWHTQRDVLLEAAHWLSLVGGSVAKIAQDVLLLTQAEIAELRESADRSSGGSSAMPQKSNPVLCESILVSVHAAESHHAALAAAHPPELQRGTITGQWEFLHLPRQCALTGGALDRLDSLAQSLVVDERRMRANVEAMQGIILAEAVTLALSVHLSTEQTRILVRDACADALRQRRHVLEILRTRTNAPVDWDKLRDESNYLGSSDRFIDAVLSEAASFSS